MSSEQGQETVKQALDVGAQAYLFKPVRREELTTLWQHVWRSRDHKSGKDGTTCAVARQEVAAGTSEGALATRTAAVAASGGQQSTEASTSHTCFTGRLSTLRTSPASKSATTVQRRSSVGSDDSTSTVPGSSEGSPGVQAEPAAAPSNDYTSDQSPMQSSGRLRKRKADSAEELGSSGRLELTIQPLDLKPSSGSGSANLAAPRLWEPAAGLSLSGRLMGLAQVAEKAEQVPSPPLPPQSLPTSHNIPCHSPLDALPLISDLLSAL